MMYVSHDERELPSAERKAQWLTHGSGRKPFFPFEWQAQGFTIGVVERKSEWN